MNYPFDIYNKTNLRNKVNIVSLDADTRPKVEALVQMVFNQYGILLLVYSARRNYGQQWDLRKIYLNGGALAASPGYSWHNFDRAVDLVPINPDGTANWNGNFSQIAEIAEGYGLKWGGYNDKNHFQNSAGQSLEAYRNANPGWEQYAKLEQQMSTPFYKFKTKKSNRNFKITILALAITGTGYAIYRNIKT